jgi:hypothetical protein
MRERREAAHCSPPTLQVLERVLGAHSRDAAEVGVDVTLAMRAAGHPDAAARHCRRALVGDAQRLLGDALELAG